MKKIINILIISIVTLLVFNCNCYAFDFEFNNNTYSIKQNIPEFPKNSPEAVSVVYSSYLLVYNCSLNSFDLLCFSDKEENIERIDERIRCESVHRIYIYNLINNSWTYSANKTRYDFPSILGNQVFLYKSEGITIDSSVYDISGDGSITLDYIYKQTEITPEGYIYNEPVIEKEITIKDIYNSLNVLTFIVTILLLYLFIKSILRVRG